MVHIQFLHKLHFTNHLKYALLTANLISGAPDFVNGPGQYELEEPPALEDLLPPVKELPL